MCFHKILSFFICIQIFSLFNESSAINSNRLSSPKLPTTTQQVTTMSENYSSLPTSRQTNITAQATMTTVSASTPVSTMSSTAAFTLESLTTSTLTLPSTEQSTLLSTVKSSTKATTTKLKTSSSTLTTTTTKIPTTATLPSCPIVQNVFATINCTVGCTVQLQWNVLDAFSSTINYKIQYWDTDSNGDNSTKENVTLICNPEDNCTVTYDVTDLHYYRNYTFVITPLVGDQTCATSEATITTCEGLANDYDAQLKVDNKFTNETSITVSWPFNLTDCNGKTKFVLNFSAVNVVSDTTDYYPCPTDETTIYHMSLAYSYPDQSNNVSESSLEPGRTYEAAVQACTKVGCGASGPFVTVTTPSYPPMVVFANDTLKSDVACSQSVSSYQMAFAFSRSFFDDSFGSPIIGYDILLLLDKNGNLSGIDKRTLGEIMFYNATTWRNSSTNNYDLPFYVTSADLNWNPFGSADVNASCCAMDESNACNQTVNESIYLIIGGNNCDEQSDPFCIGSLPPATNFLVTIRANVAQFNNKNSETTSNFAGPSYIVALATAQPYNPTVGANVGLIVGLVIACLALALLFVLAAFFFYKRQKKNRIQPELPFEPTKPQRYKHQTRILLKDYQRILKLYASHSNIELAEEFEDLNDVSPKLDKKPTNAAILEENLQKNRFINILPFDDSRVKLEDVESDYINASFIDGFSRFNEYISTQGPMDEEDEKLRSRKPTINDFWLMVWQQNVNCVVMLTKCHENGRTKCAQYWPKAVNEKMNFGDIDVQLIEELDKNNHYITRKFLITKKDDSKYVLQYHYLNWDDMQSIDAEDLLHFINIVRTSGNIHQNPTLVHCSAGVGRTGTFIALDILLQHIKKYDYIDVFECVYKMRQHRINMVQTEKQYISIYKCLSLALEKDSTFASSSDTSQTHRLSDVPLDDDPMESKL